MNNDKLKELWLEKFKVVDEQIKKTANIQTVATAFNTNIDAIIKIKGSDIEKLIKENNISLNEIENIKISSFRKESDVILGIIKCFTRGIAEEWVTEDISIYNWLDNNLGYDRLQMGGQAGIIANVLALLGIKKVVCHTNSHPLLQAKQFLDLDNLFAVNKDGLLLKANSLQNNNDIPLIHWIIEFDKNDTFCVNGNTFSCPKSNRFIATYDPLNMKLALNNGFVSFINNNNVDYLLLSGFHALLEKNDGLNLISKTVDVIRLWKEKNPKMIIHLEIASTQDKVIRKSIIDSIAPLAHSVGLNERETIDLLQITNQDDLANRIEQQTNSCNLFEAIMFLKKKLGVQRIQLHMFGLYLTIQDKDFIYSPEQNLKGMMTASIVSSSKAFNGELIKPSDLTKTIGESVSNQGLRELEDLSLFLNKPELLIEGVCELDGMYVSAIPTILIDKPKTLVGMGDTISSISLLAGR